MDIPLHRIRAFIESEDNRRWLLKEGFKLNTEPGSLEVWYNEHDERVYFRQGTLVRSNPYKYDPNAS